MGNQVGKGRTAVAGCLSRVRRYVVSTASVSVVTGAMVSGPRAQGTSTGHVGM